jgi:hypothetical protein
VAQAWPQYIPTHLHFSGRKGRQEYQYRHCVYCHQQGALGDETHIFLRCPATASLIGETAIQINKILRLFDALPWSSFTDTQRVSILLGNSPPSRRWRRSQGIGNGLRMERPRSRVKCGRAIDRPFIVLTDAKSSYRHIPVWARYSPHRTRVEAHTNTLSP